MRRETKHTTGEEAMRESQTIQWTSGDGRAIHIAISLAVPHSLAGNPRTAEQTPERVIRIDATVDGAEVSHNGLETIEHPVVAARLGRIGITREHLAEIETAIDSLEATDEYHASEAMWAEWADRQDKYDAETTAINNVMED